MYNNANIHYIFRQSSGEIIDFYFSERFGICCSSLTKKNVWTNPVSINKSAHSLFSADMDTEDRFHMLLQDMQGNLHYTIMEGSSIRSLPILSSRNPNVYNKHLKIIPLKDEVHFFYVLKQERAPILSHQVLGKGGKGSNPRVVDYVGDNSCPVCLVYDGKDEIYAFYQVNDGKYYQLGEKRYDLNTKRWSEFNQLTDNQGDCGFPKAIADKAGTIHLCYQKSSPGQFELVYRQKKAESRHWSGELLMHSSVYNFENASILWLNDSLIVYWLRDDIIYCRIGYQSGNNWGKPYKYNFPYRGSLYNLVYKTNYPDEAEKTAVCNIPGCLTGGLKLAFYKFIPNNGETLTVENVRDLILESFRMLRNSTEELREENGRLKEQLSVLKNRQAELEKEIIELAMKFKDFVRKSQSRSQGGD